MLVYTRRELAVRIGYLFVASALAGACGGLLAFAIGNLDGTSGMRGWRWILIIEYVLSPHVPSVLYLTELAATEAFHLSYSALQHTSFSLTVRTRLTFSAMKRSR